MAYGTIDAIDLITTALQKHARRLDSLDAADRYDGTLILNTHTLTLLSDATLDFGGGTLTLASGGTLALGGFALTLLSSGTLDIGGFTLTVPATGTATLGTGTSGRITEWGGTNSVQASTLAKTGAGVLTLNAGSAYTVTVTANATISGSPPTGTGVTGRISEWTSATDLQASTLVKSGAGVLTLSASSAFTLTVPATGTAALGTGTSGRITEWGGTNSVQASTLAKTGAGVLTLAAASAYTVTVIGNTTIGGTSLTGTGVAGRISEWTSATDLQESTLVKSGVGVLTLSASGAFTLTVPATGTAALGTGTTGRITEWGGTNSVQASTLVKSGAGVLTLAAASAYTVTVTANATISGSPPTGTGVAGRISEWTSATDLQESTLVKSGVGVLTLSASGAFTLTVPATGTAALGTGTTGRITEWGGTNSVQASTLAKTGAGVLTFSASSAYTITVLSGGTLDLAGAVLNLPVDISQGGTGAITAGAARAALNAAGSGANSDITSLTGLTTPLSSTYGGTGVNNGARTLTIATSGTAAVGTGTSGRITEWGGTNSLQASTLAKTGAGVLTLSAGSAYTLTVAASATINGTPPSGSATTGQVAYWDGSTSLSGDSSMTYDAVNNRLTVGRINVGTATGALAGDVRASGNIISASFLQSAAGSPFDMGGYVPTPVTATGHVRIQLNGVVYKLLTST